MPSESGVDFTGLAVGGAEIAASIFVPGAGDALDAATLLNPNSSTSDRVIAGVSLLAGFGPLPNLGPLVRRGLNFGADTLPGRSGAFRLAKEAAGVPRSAQPRVYRERIYDQARNVRGRVYEFTRADGSVVTIREHSLGHVKGSHGPHFNVEVRPPGGGPKQPLPGGGNGHHYFEP